jgi:hypothetical protein
VVRTRAFAAPTPAGCPNLEVDSTVAALLSPSMCMPDLRNRHDELPHRPDERFREAGKPRMEGEQLEPVAEGEVGVGV